MIRLKSHLLKMNKPDLLMVVGRLITLCAKTHAKELDRIADIYEKNDYKFVKRSLRMEADKASNLRYIKDGNVFFDFRAQIIELAKSLEFYNDGFTSREMILNLHHAHPELKLVDVSNGQNGIAKPIKVSLANVLELAGFERTLRYRPKTKKTENLWALPEGYRHIPATELIRLFELKLADTSTDNALERFL